MRWFGSDTASVVGHTGGLTVGFLLLCYSVVCTVVSFVCLFLLLYVPSQQLWSLRDGQFTKPHFFPGQA